MTDRPNRTINFYRHIAIKLVSDPFFQLYIFEKLGEQRIKLNKFSFFLTFRDLNAKQVPHINS